MKQTKKRIFSWGLWWECTCSHGEQEATSASPGGLPVPLGRSWELLSTLWGQLRLTWPNSYMYLSPNSIAAKGRPVSIVGTEGGLLKDFQWDGKDLNLESRHFQLSSFHCSLKKSNAQSRTGSGLFRYSTDTGFTKLISDLTHDLCRCMERLLFFLSFTAPGAQLWFWPHLCMCTTLRCLFSAQARGKKAAPAWGTLIHSDWGMHELPMVAGTVSQL